MVRLCSPGSFYDALMAAAGDSAAGSTGEVTMAEQELTAAAEVAAAVSPLIMFLQLPQKNLNPVV